MPYSVRRTPVSVYKDKLYAKDEWNYVKDKVNW